MSKSVADELVELASSKKSKNNYRKGGKPTMKRINLETVKTVTIFVLVTAIIAFIGGMKYQSQYSASVKAEAKSLTNIVKQPAAVEASKQ